MQNKEEIEDSRIPKQLAKALGIHKDDDDSLIAFKESLFEETVKENIKLKKQVEQLETEKQKLIEKLEEDIENNNFKETECLEDKGRYYYAKEILKILKGENE